MTTFVSSTNASLPKLSYLKSIDIFLIFCFFAVFMSLMEYAAVSYKANKYVHFTTLQQIWQANEQNQDQYVLFKASALKYF